MIDHDVFSKSRIVESMCGTMRHDFGIDRHDEFSVCGMTEQERDAMRRSMGQLFDHHILPIIEKLEQVESELQGSEYTVIALGELLRGVANAIKGEPEPGTCHSFHDLPERAEAVMQCLKLQGIGLASAQNEKQYWLEHAAGYALESSGLEGHLDKSMRINGVDIDELKDAVLNGYHPSAATLLDMISLIKAVFAANKKIVQAIPEPIRNYPRP